ncbi:putative ABC transport system ATP-binding protein [Hamadaea flava]|uniref:ATP-binding cassette domain-containing protein n=1 Tax=Hamadaea flava TaxID=1742688 RepID=A0ABV8LLJ1_9ACTN|nr:ATP-binding cassette domain-containing protein [Hamadaea flava]MCP2323802.1 putative ABC transport system ATP-binding protein [Hamadaea flava]
MTFLKLDGVTVAYEPDRPVLADFVLSAYPGRIIAVTGPSGAGKTTLLWTLAGLIRPQAGEVTADGEPLRGRQDAIARGVALIPQGNGLEATLTASENVLLPLIAGGMPGEEAETRTAAALERLGLSGQADQLVEELSGGQQQRTAVARGLAANAKVLLADEITSELDAVNRRLVLELLQEECRRGVAVVFATHDPQAAEACDEVVALA